MLRHIVPLLPSHHLYFEPFFGGFAVFFAKRPLRIEWINNDKDGFVVNFYRQVQSHFVALHGLLSETLHSRLAYTQCATYFVLRLAYIWCFITYAIRFDILLLKAEFFFGKHVN